MKVCVHQGSVLSPLLFIIVLEALSLSPLEGPLCWWPYYHRWIAEGMYQEALDLERSKGGERTESKCRKDKNHDLWYGPEPPAEFRRVSICRLSHWSQQKQHLLQWLQALGAQEMQWAQALDKGPWFQMYTVPGNCKPFGRQTTEGSQSRTSKARGYSFLLLPRKHTLSSQWQWTFNHNMCENRLKEVQVAAISSLFQDKWPCVQLLCAERSATWDLAIDKANTPTSAVEWQGNDQTDLQCQCKNIFTIRSNELLAWLGIEDLDILKERRFHWHEHKPPMVKSRQPATYRLMESLGLGGPRWHGSCWQRLQRVEALSYWPSW